MRRKRLIQSSDSTLEHDGVNLTPLIDVVFVVLILFILIAPMLELEKVQLAGAPQKDHHENTLASGENVLAIHVHKNDTIWINKQEIAEEKLRPLLKALYYRNPKLTPQLFQDRGAHFGTYQNVKNAIEEAGFTELDLLLEPGK